MPAPRAHFLSSVEDFGRGDRCVSQRVIGLSSRWLACGASTLVLLGASTLVLLGETCNLLTKVLLLLPA